MIQKIVSGPKNLNTFYQHFIDWMALIEHHYAKYNYLTVERKIYVISKFCPHNQIFDRKTHKSRIRHQKKHHVSKYNRYFLQQA